MKKRNITIRDIASGANVSVATVSRYLNSNGYVDEATGEKIAKVIKEMDYHPNRLAQGLKKKETKNIVLIMPDIQNPFYSTMAAGAQKILMEQGYTATLFNTYSDRKSELESIQMAQTIGADGILFAGVSLDTNVSQALKKSDRPSVIVNIPEVVGFDTVEGDAGISTYLSTRYLIEMGHLKIAFVGAALGNGGSKRRQNGYLQAMEKAGYPVRKEYIFTMGTVLSSEVGMKAGYYFSALPDRPTAICCSNDLVALGIYQAFHQLGISIPGDISLTGVDNIMYADLCNPRLTTVTNDSNEYARTAVKALLERIQGKYTGTPRIYTIDRTLIARDSVRRL